MTIAEIVTQLKEGKTMLYPTDTILGLGCNAMDEEAIQKIYDLKKRPDAKSFIVLVDTPARLQSIVDVPELAWDLMDYNEKPLTIIYDDPKGLPQKLIAADRTIGIRLTKDPLCIKIIQALKAPIVSTSANISGQPSPRTIDEVDPAIIQKVDLVLEEVHYFVPKSEASTIIKLGKDHQVKIIRQ